MKLLEVATYIDNLPQGSKVDITKFKDYEGFVNAVKYLIRVNEVKGVCFTDDYKFLRIERYDVKNKI